jgi:hypothetical protein
MKIIAVGIVLTCSTCVAGASAAQDAKPTAKTIEVPFTSHDGYPMFGKLTLPESGTD